MQKYSLTKSMQGVIYSQRSLVHTSVTTQGRREGAVACFRENDPETCSGFSLNEVLQEKPGVGL